ncbi:hypothetical protein OH799_11455 [Nocardia sp. NBC_00881]|uniref:hypothetical protein n=1 Tax=Nocardia sp. NBC_00881 TaxID=2975995 RepID=UPI0038647A13|nr:hypothetical protein OH799_11455 [Nocardia sp. NBC_00881]
MDNTVPRTVLEQLIRQSERNVPEWCAYFNTTATELREDATLSERQLRRWMAGNVPDARSSSQRVARRVWKLAFETLVSPPESVDSLEPVSSTLDRLNQEIAMSTDDSARWVKRGAGGADKNVLDQLHADVANIAAEYLLKAPLELIPALTSLRREVFDMLDARQRPRFLPDLYLIAGQVCALMAHACADLGRAYDADTHARTAWFAADYAEDQHLRAYVRWVQANVAYWSRDYGRAAQYAKSGLADMTDDSTRLRLASQLGRAEAARGDDRAALAALDVAMDALGRSRPVAAEPGVMYFDPGKARYYAAEVHLALGGRQHCQLALEQAQAALEVFTDSSPKEFVAAAELDAAQAHLGLGDIEAAAARVDQVLALPVELRTTPIIERVTKTADVFTAVSARARVTRELTERISLFTTYTAQQERSSKE